MKLDPSKSLEYFKYRDLICCTFADACDAATRYFELDQAKDLDKRLKSLEDHYDDLIFWRCQEVFDQLPEELVPKTSSELDDLMMFLTTLDPVQPISHKRV